MSSPSLSSHCFPWKNYRKQHFLSAHTDFRRWRRVSLVDLNSFGPYSDLFQVNSSSLKKNGKSSVNVTNTSTTTITTPTIVMNRKIEYA